MTAYFLWWGHPVVSSEGEKKTPRIVWALGGGRGDLQVYIFILTYPIGRDLGPRGILYLDLPMLDFQELQCRCWCSWALFAAVTVCRSVKAVFLNFFKLRTRLCLMSERFRVIQPHSFVLKSFFQCPTAEPSNIYRISGMPGGKVVSHHNFIWSCACNWNGEVGMHFL